MRIRTTEAPRRRCRDEPAPRARRPRAAWRATTRPRSTWRCASTPTSRPSRRRPRSRDASRGRARAASSGTATPTAPPRELRARDRRPPRRRARAGLRGQRVERGAADAAASPTAGRAARSPCSSRPTRCTRHIARAHRHRGRRAASAPPTSRSTSTRCAGSLARRATRDHVPVLAEQPDRDGRDRGDGARGARPGRPGWSWSTRPTASSRRGRRSSWSTTTCRWSSPARTRRRGRWRPPASATSSGPSWLVAELDKVVLPYHLDAVEADRRRARARLRRRDGGRGSPRWSRSAGGSSAALRDLPRRRVAVGRQLRAVPARAPRRRGDACGRRCSTGRCWCATARRGLASTAACGSRSAPPTRTTLPRRARRRSWRDDDSRLDGRTQRARPRRPTIAVELDVDGTGHASR